MQQFKNPREKNFYNEDTIQTKAVPAYWIAPKPKKIIDSHEFAGFMYFLNHLDYVKLCGVMLITGMAITTLLITCAIIVKILLAIWAMKISPLQGG